MYLQRNENTITLIFGGVGEGVLSIFFFSVPWAVCYWIDLDLIS